MIIPFSPTRPDIGKQASLSPRATLSHPRPPAGGQQSGLEPLEPRMLLSASISAQFVPVNNTAALSGFSTYDLQVTTATGADWVSSALLIELTQGSIYQDLAGTERAPNPLLLNEFPSLEFDTYLTANGNPLVIGDRAVTLGGNKLQFDTTEIDITWAGFTSNDIGTLVIGRVTLSDDAAGSIGVMAKDSSGTPNRLIDWNTFTSGDLVNLTPAPPRPTSPPRTPPPPNGALDASVNFVEVDNTAALTGFRTFDLQVTTNDDWTATAFLLELSRGSIYQDPRGTNLAPPPGAFGAFPALEFDTYVTANGNPTMILGGAGDVGGNWLQFDTTELDIAWGDIPDNDVGTVVIGRVTLSNNAAGNISLMTTRLEHSFDHLVVSDTFKGGDLSTVSSDSIPSNEPPAPPPLPPKPFIAQFLAVDNAAVLPGFKSFDLQITADTDWSDASLLIDLTRGSIYQDAAGTDLSPNPVTFSAFPTLEFDTYVTANSLLTSIGGDAEKVGVVPRFDAGQIDISWSGPSTLDTGTFIIGRVTLSDDAAGGLKFVVAGDQIGLTDFGTFETGDLAKMKSTFTPASAAAADFTGDGKADILWRDATTGLSSIWQMNRTAFMSSIDLQLLKNPRWQAVAAGDLTGDGKADILWRNTRNGRNLVSVMDGTALQANVSLKQLRNRHWQVAGISDLTGDGKADILWRHARNGRNSVWEMDGTTFRGGIAIQPEANRDMIIAGVTDFTGDGKADILWRNRRSGSNSVWEMDGTVFQTSTAIKQVKSQRWQVAGVGDYTGDGRADILWRDPKKGKNRVWEMKGTDLRINIPLQSQTDRGLQPGGTLLGLWE